MIPHEWILWLSVIGLGLLMSWRRKNRTAFFGLVAALGVLIVPQLIFHVKREGTVVATAEFNPGIAPFSIEVRKVPVPVTHSEHFIVTLRRGQYVVSSFRYFWPDFTPSRVTISWPCINSFTVTFDDQYEATCDWSFGSAATWMLKSIGGDVKPGLSPYFFTPRNPIPANCPQIPLEGVKH